MPAAEDLPEAAAQTELSAGDLRLPHAFAKALIDPIGRLPDLKLEECDVGVDDDSIRFHRISGASGYVALLYFDDARPEARHPSWYLSSLCVRICADARSHELDAPAIVFLAPDDGLRQRWGDEAEQCRKSGMARAITIAAVGRQRQWTSVNILNGFAREWTAPLRSAGGGRTPAPYSTNDQFVLSRRTDNGYTGDRQPQRRLFFETAGAQQRLTPEPSHVSIRRYYVFLASPNDLQAEREKVRAYFRRFNRTIASEYGLEFEVLDWEHYSTAGRGDPQSLIFKQVLDTHERALVLFICLLGSRFGQPTATHGSGTEAEFEWALSTSARQGWPEMKLFFKRLALPADAPYEAAEQYMKVRAFQQKVEKSGFLCKPFDDTSFDEVVENDLQIWLQAQVNRFRAEFEWSEETRR